MLNVLKLGSSSLELIGKIDAERLDVLEQVIKLIGACYGQPKVKSMSEARVREKEMEKVSRTGATNTPPPAILKLRM